MLRVSVKISQLFPAGDPLAAWMFSLSALTDDLAVFDDHLHASLDENGSRSVLYFRLIVARLYEGERVVKAMDSYATIASFLGSIPTTVRPCAQLRVAYQRDLTVKVKAQQSRIERTFGRARHLTTHYPQHGELARILRDAGNLEARRWRDHERGLLRYLWPQDVMEHALWPHGAAHRPDVDFAHELTQAFVDVFKFALPAYFDRVGVSHSDLMQIGPDSEQA